MEKEFWTYKTGFWLLLAVFFAGGVYWVCFSFMAVFFMYIMIIAEIFMH